MQCLIFRSNIISTFPHHPSCHELSQKAKWTIRIKKIKEIFTPDSPDRHKQQRRRGCHPQHCCLWSGWSPWTPPGRHSRWSSSGSRGGRPPRWTCSPPSGPHCPPSRTRCSSLGPSFHVHPSGLWRTRPRGRCSLSRSPLRVSTWWWWLWLPFGSYYHKWSSYSNDDHNRYFHAKDHYYWTCW